MATLSKALRNQLEKVVAQARTIAVAGAERALNDELAVGAGRPWQGMSAEHIELRKALRAHGRQLGDKRDPRSGEQETRRLVQACAYEHWNRMLFARFLVENNLLLDTEHGLSLTMNDVQELAREQGREWMQLASELAQRMLLSVFDPRDPVLRVKLPVETRLQLDQKLASLLSEVFLADDSLGWVYQFWQKDEKKRVNKSEVKIGADELPAVTQLFTEDYMVLFLLENTLGAWWTVKRVAAGLDPKLLGYEWTYLRFNEDGTPAAGAFDAWPKAAREITVFDPCMGSGHFLTFALRVLTRMRQEEEGLSLCDAMAAVMRDNLFGLELDARCSQIAAFNLALTAWRWAGEHFPLPQMNLACSGLGVHASESDWVALAGEDGRAQEGMRRLYSLFQDAPTLGSLIDPLRLRTDVISLGTDEILPLLEHALTLEKEDEEKREMIVAAQGVLAAFQLLARQYTLVATNVPFLGRGRFGDTLGEICDRFYSDAAADLSTCMLERCIRFTSRNGNAALVCKQEPLFLKQYTDFRISALSSLTWDVVAKLGPRAFRAVSGERVNVALLVLRNLPPGQDHEIGGVEVETFKTPDAKAVALRTETWMRAKQSSQSANPDSRVILSPMLRTQRLSDFAVASAGHLIGDSARFERFFWEVADLRDDWEPLQSTVEKTGPDGGRSGIIFWQREKGGMYELAQSVRHLNHVAQNWLRGKPSWGKRGVIVSQMGDLPATLYLGQIYDCNCCAIVPKNDTDLPAIWAYCSSTEFAREVRKLDQKMNVAPHTLLKVPFDRHRWAAAFESELGGTLPAPGASDPREWLFASSISGAQFPMQVALARVLGFQWPRETQCGSRMPVLESFRRDEVEMGVTPTGILSIQNLNAEQGAEECLLQVLDRFDRDQRSAILPDEVSRGDLSLRYWLRDKFSSQHCNVFEDHPFIWHIWDGQLDGFHAFVNYHRLAGPNGEGRKALERLTYTLLNDWIERQSFERERKVDGAETRLAAAVHLQSELKKILQGEPPYDIFVRWKPLHEQPIGWEPDINDGVRINIRPFLNAKPYKGSRNSSILRITPKIKYGKDRGKEPWRPTEEYPWFWGWDERTQDFTGGDTFDGARWNDLHYSNEMKRKARAKKAEADASKS